MKRKQTHDKILWITQTALMLAILIVLQAATKGLSQLVTGSCVNAVLAVSALFGGLWSGLTVALISPVLAFGLGIAPQAVTVPAIMAGNAAFVAVLYFVSGKTGLVWRRILAWLTAALCKFAVLSGLVAGIICGLAAQPLLDAGLLKAPMLTKLPAMFTLPQLVTALIGGGVALLTVPLLKKALKKVICQTKCNTL